MIHLHVRDGAQEVFITDDRLPGNTIRLAVPEWFCEEDGHIHIGEMKPRWTEVEPSRAIGVIAGPEGRADLRILADAESVAVTITLSNNTHRTWRTVSDFCCWSFMPAPDFADYELARTFVWRAPSSGPGVPAGGSVSGSSGTGVPAGELVRSLQLHRPGGERPLFLFQPVGDRTRFERVKPLVNKRSTCLETLAAGAISVVSRDGRWSATVEAVSPLFAFNNGEYACLHSCPDYGHIAPGATAARTTRLRILPVDSAA